MKRKFLSRSFVNVIPRFKYFSLVWDWNRELYFHLISISLGIFSNSSQLLLLFIIIILLFLYFEYFPIKKKSCKSIIISTPFPHPQQFIWIILTESPILRLIPCRKGCRDYIFSPKLLSGKSENYRLKCRMQAWPRK